MLKLQARAANTPSCSLMSLINRVPCYSKAQSATERVSVFLWVFPSCWFTNASRGCLALVGLAGSAVSLPVCERPLSSQSLSSFSPWTWGGRISRALCERTRPEGKENTKQPWKVTWPATPSHTQWRQLKKAVLLNRPLWALSDWACYQYSK